jgi:hypothetical protein
MWSYPDVDRHPATAPYRGLSEPPACHAAPNLLNLHRVAWALRNRHTNGLFAAGAVFDSPCGELLVHEPTFLAWFLGLAGRSKPRRTRSARSAA